MARRTATLWTLGLIWFLSLTIPLAAEQFGDFTYSSDGSAITITGYTGAGGAVTIPGGIAGLPVRTIGSAFSANVTLTSVNIPDSVTSIEEEAFALCNGLTSVNIPSTVSTIGNYAFLGCGSLTGVTIPISVTFIGTGAFYGCGSLTSVAIPDWLTSIEEAVFYDCASLSSVIIPNGVTSIGNSAFVGCTALTSVIIPNSVTSIGDYAFYGCESLTSVVIPNSITSIGDFVFAWSGLTSVTIPSSATQIAGNAFYYCDNLNNIEVAAGNTVYHSMGGVLFDKNQAILIQYPHGKTGNYVIPEGVTSIGDSAFYSCVNLTSVVIPNSLTSIADFAFAWSGLTSVTVPAGVTQIGKSAFYGCGDLKNINVAAGNTVYNSMGGVLFDKNQAILIQYPHGKTGDSYAIPEGVTSIGDYAFYLCLSLTSVTIPEGVALIGEGAFYDCRALTSVAIPSSVTSIGERAFYGCENLASVTFQGNMPAIFGFSVFRETAPGFTIYYYEGNAGFTSPTWQGYTTVPLPSHESPITDFTYTSNGSSITITKYTGTSSAVWIPSTIVGLPVTTIGRNAFSFNDTLNNVIIPEGVTTIGSEAFYATPLTYLAVPTSLISIGELAFAITHLTNVVIPANVTSIGRNSFFSCSRLLSIEVVVDNTAYRSNDGVLFNVGQNTLLQYPAGKEGSYRIPAGVRYIADSAFSACTKLSNVVIPNSVVSIGDHAFYFCRSLGSVIIPDSVTSIGGSAFTSCERLTGSTFEGKAPTSFGSYVFDFTAPSFRVFYYEVNTGFTSPTWQGYPAVALTIDAGPILNGVRAAQRVGTGLVDVYYDVISTSGPVSIQMESSTDDGKTWTLPVTTLSGDHGSSVVTGTNKHVIWNAGVDWNNQQSDTVRFRITATKRPHQTEFVRIPAGEFQMGDALNEGASNELPVHNVHMSEFYIGKHEVTNTLWDEVLTWGPAHGYTDLNINIGAGGGEVSTHPVHSVNWSAAVKWCNARSEWEGLTPCYIAGGEVHRTGTSNNVECIWSTNGYRLPTEAEWEKAARGTLSGTRFAWGNTISHSQANYSSSSNYPYDVSSTRGNHPEYVDSHTSPVGSFPPNGYGLHDVAGNV